MGFSLQIRLVQRKERTVFARKRPVERMAARRRDEVAGAVV